MERLAAFCLVALRASLVALRASLEYGRLLVLVSIKGLFFCVTFYVDY